MNCVIIGTGWLGFPLAVQLAKSGYQVWGSSRSERNSEVSGFTHFVYPADSTPLKQADVVIIAFPPNRSTTDAYANDCMQVVSQCSPSCRIILISSTGAYDKTGICTENDVIHDPESSNILVRAESKLREVAGERLTIVRLAGLIGPNRYPIRNMHASGKTYAGNDPVNVIHLEDAVGLVRYIAEQTIVGETVNGCSPEHPSRKKFYSKMAEKTGLPVPLFDDTYSDSKVIDSTKSIQLGYHYTFTDPMDFSY